MQMRAVGMYIVAAAALLGSPGPGIAALLAIGKSRGWSGGLRYFAGLQVGLAVVVAASGAGLVSLLTVYPALVHALIVAAALYLAYLAFSIATSPLGQDGPMNVRAYSARAGLVLGITNPKAYLAIGSLLASPLRLANGGRADIALKQGLCMAVILIVDLAWLWVGVAVGRTRMLPIWERVMNVAMGVLVLMSIVVSF